MLLSFGIYRIYEFVYLTYRHCLHAFLFLESMSHLTILELQFETHVQLYRNEEELKNNEKGGIKHCSNIKRNE